jgi:hypothetical protein
MVDLFENEQLRKDIKAEFLKRKGEGKPCCLMVRHRFLKCNLNEIVNRPQLITKKMVTTAKILQRALR